MRGYRIGGVILRHTYEVRRNFDRLADIAYWPILEIIVWGFLTIFLTTTGNGLTPTLASFLLGAVILWGFFYAFQRDMAIGFLDELWSRNLLNIFSTPITIWEYITGLVIINFFKVAIGFIVAALLARALYTFNIFPFSLLLLPYFANLLLFALALGVVTAALIFRYTTKIQGLAWGFAGLLQPVSCVFYPLSVLPGFLQSVAWYLPTTHSFEGMRGILAGGGFSMSHFWWGLALNAVYLVLAILFFRVIFRAVKKRGLLVKIE